MSAIDSMPTARRTSPGVTPAESRSSSPPWLWVVDAGWIASERTSPMLATWLCSDSPSTKRWPASSPPTISKASTAPAPWGAYLSARALLGLLSSDAQRTDSTWGCDSRNDATMRAFSTCRSTRRLSVSTPCAMRKALNGEIADPRSRSSCTRALRM